MDKENGWFSFLALTVSGSHHFHLFFSIFVSVVAREWTFVALEGSGAEERGDECWKSRIAAGRVDVVRVAFCVVVFVVLRCVYVCVCVDVDPLCGQMTAIFTLQRTTKAWDRQA